MQAKLESKFCHCEILRQQWRGNLYFALAKLSLLESTCTLDSSFSLVKVSSSKVAALKATQSLESILRAQGY